MFKVDKIDIVPFQPTPYGLIYILPLRNGTPNIYYYLYLHCNALRHIIL